MKRIRFKRSACASSSGAYVKHSHERYLRECHEQFSEINITISVTPRYFTRCNGKLFELTPREAMMRRHLNIIIKQ